MRTLRLATLFCALAVLSGCATMAGRGPERIGVESDPPGADVSVHCGAEVVDTGVTPATVAVPRVEEDCIVTVSKAGFAPRDVLLESGMNPRFWLNLPLTFGVPVALVYVVFNPDPSGGDRVALGLGAIGAAGMIVDSVTGAKRDHDPKTIRVTLVPAPANPVD